MIASYLPKHRKTVATGVWLYDRTVPRRIEIARIPAEHSRGRYDDYDELDEMIPIPETKDGYLYHVVGPINGEFLSVEEAIAWANEQPWGPVSWDEQPG
jgi:hypothetical protein